MTSLPELAITHGYIVPMVGPVIPDGTVLIRDGVIAAVGPTQSTPLPEGITQIDAAGQWVLPGLVEAHGHMGMWEEGGEWAGDDVNETTNPNGAHLRAVDGLNPHDEAFLDAVRAGVTSAIIKPGSANAIGGQTVAIKTWGGRTVDEQIIAATVSMKSALGENPKRCYGQQKQLPNTRMGIAAVIRSALMAAQDYQQRREQATSENPTERDLGKEALVQVLAGELIWDQHVHRSDDIATALRLADEFGYRMVINHGTEAATLADLLAERDIPVVYGPLIIHRSKNEVRARDTRNVVRLAEAGVRIALTTDHPVVPIDYLMLQASLAVKEGLDRQIALAAVTSAPASFYGLDHRIGSLQPGLDADVVLWSGDPLDPSSEVNRVFISGVQVHSRDQPVHRPE